MLHDLGYEPDALEVRVSELLIATADGGDALINPSITEVLRLLREHLKMDVVFVSEFVDGHRVFKRVDAKPGSQVIAEGESAPLEQRAREAEKKMADWRLEPKDEALRRTR